jgi:hypothetical protein
MKKYIYELTTNNCPQSQLEENFVICSANGNIRDLTVTSDVLFTQDIFLNKCFFGRSLTRLMLIHRQEKIQMKLLIFSRNVFW